MKLNLEVDCTPDEARAFLGLPDIAPMQARILEQMEERMREAIDQTDTQELIEKWLPLGVKGMEQWQSMWMQMARAAAGFTSQGGAGQAGRAKKP